jgi:hypothetical protein
VRKAEYGSAEKQRVDQRSLHDLGHSSAMLVPDAPVVLPFLSNLGRERTKVR